MTIKQAIDAADALRPANPYSAAVKAGWLSTLDGVLHLSVICGEAAGCPKYADDTAELLVPAPFDELYPTYLAAKIDFCDGEWESYHQTMQMYNMQEAEFARDYIRRNRPASNAVKL